MEDINLTDKILDFARRAVNQYKSENPDIQDTSHLVKYETMLAGIVAYLYLEYSKLYRTSLIWKGDRSLDGGGKFVSEAKLNRMWGASEDGQRMIEIEYQIKSCKMIIDSCKDALRRLNAEAYNTL